MPRVLQSIGTRTIESPLLVMANGAPVPISSVSPVSPCRFLAVWHLTYNGRRIKVSPNPKAGTYLPAWAQLLRMLL